MGGHDSMRLLKTLVAGLCMVVLAGTAQAQSVTWSMATPWGGGVFLEEAKNFAKKVDELTEGRVKITVFPAGTLGKALKVTDSVKSGVAQAGNNWMGYDWGIDKTTVIFGGYVGGLTEEEYFLWLYRAGGIELWEKYRMEKFGVVSMACGIFPAEVFLHSKKKVTNLAEYKGIKQRTAGAWAEVGGQLGATTVILPGAEVYAALERGVIDATEWSGPSANEPVGFHKIAKYIIFPGIHQPGATQECEFNKAAWDKISKRDQMLIKMAGKLSTFDSWTGHAYKDLAAYRRFEKGGNTMLRLEQSFIDTAQKVGNEWADKVAAENPKFKEILNHQRQFQMDMSVYSKMRIAPGSRTAIGKILK
jgi:TRAP-type mannitol/chloroaromatic compound transport system substrate-binding protein